MKFGKNLLRVAEISDPEWVPYWVNYKALKKIIKEITGKEKESIGSTDKCASSESSEASTSTSLQAIFRQVLAANKGQQPAEGKTASEVQFFISLHAEMVKASKFFERIMEEYDLRVGRLHEGHKLLREHNVCDDRWLILARSAFQVYKDLLLLETYAIMTYCAFSKILKKHDKMTGRNTRVAFMKTMVNGANFTDTDKLQVMIKGIEARYQEASEHLVKAGRANLQDDERLFLSMVTKLSTEAITGEEREELAQRQKASAPAPPVSSPPPKRQKIEVTVAE